MTPVRMRSPRIFRVLLQVHDLTASRRFYESLLGTRGREVGGGRVYFDCGPTLLAVVEASEGSNPGPVPSPEPLYFSVDALEPIFRRAVSLGCLSRELIHHDPANPAGEIVVRPWGERSFYAQDLSGNPLCFVESGTEFTGRARRPVGGHRRTRRPRRPSPGRGRGG